MNKKKKKLPSIAKEKGRIQKIVNAYIRKRDSQDGWFTCISCGKTKTTDRMDSGHYVPISRSQHLRFNEWNLNGECKDCNGFDEFHLIGYKKNLIDKIGIDAVDYLERDAHEIRTYKHTRQELEEIENYYKGMK